MIGPTSTTTVLQIFKKSWQTYIAPSDRVYKILEIAHVDEEFQGLSKYLQHSVAVSWHVPATVSSCMYSQYFNQPGLRDLLESWILVDNSLSIKVSSTCNLDDWWTYCCFSIRTLVTVTARAWNSLADSSTKSYFGHGGSQVGPPDHHLHSRPVDRCFSTFNSVANPMNGEIRHIL